MFQGPQMLSAKSTLIAAICTGFLTACASTTEQSAAREAELASFEAEVAARRGEAVNRFCPRGSDGWQPLSNDALLMEAGNEWYMVELAGTCDPEGAFNAIATRGTAGSSCLSRGDDLFTGRPRSIERCAITAMYEWDMEAEVE